MVDCVRQAAIKRGVLVVENTESYTTKTCPKCGTHNDHVYASKTFVCIDEECGYTHGRDKKSPYCIIQRTADDLKKEKNWPLQKQ